MDRTRHPCCIPLTKQFPKLTFDELLPYGNILDVTRLDHESRVEQPASILEAARSMRPPKSKKPTSYAIKFSCDSNLDKALSIPKEVESIDLYSNFWPNKGEKSYLKSRGRVFQGFQQGFKSPPTILYGGTSQWIHVISGSVRFKLYKPTPRNIAQASADFQGRARFEEGETFRLQAQETCLITPTGWIICCKAKENSFVISGEFLHFKDFTNQLQNFERDVMMYNASFAIERDREIRFLYWFTAAQLLQSSSNWDRKDLEYLKEALSDWRKRFKMITNPPNLYAPIGLNLDVIIRDLGTHLRRSLKSVKDPANVVRNKRSAHNKTN